MHHYGYTNYFILGDVGYRRRLRGRFMIRFFAAHYREDQHKRKGKLIKAGVKVLMHDDEGIKTNDDPCLIPNAACCLFSLWHIRQTSYYIFH
jgi:hypothetical protein